jgi:hypothetical protein
MSFNEVFRFYRLPLLKVNEFGSRCPPLLPAGWEVAEFLKTQCRAHREDLPIVEIMADASHNTGR